MTKITLKGNAINTSGALPKIGSLAQDFKLTANDLTIKTLNDFKGKTLVLNIFPSIDTGTWKLRLDNSSVFSDFFGLRAEVTLEKETPEFRKVQVRAEMKLLNFVEDDFYEF